MLLLDLEQLLFINTDPTINISSQSIIFDIRRNCTCINYWSHTHFQMLTVWTVFVYTKFDVCHMTAIEWIFDFIAMFMQTMCIACLFCILNGIQYYSSVQNNFVTLFRIHNYKSLANRVWWIKKKGKNKHFEFGKIWHL